MAYRVKAKSLAAIVITMLVFHISIASGGCLKKKVGGNKKYIQFKGDLVNITIATTSRVSHQIASHAFKVFIKEILNYPDVEVVYREDNFDVATAYQALSIFDNDGNAMSFVPEILINLEAWVPPEYDTINYLESNSIKECGNVGVSGRFGWFIPINLVKSGMTSMHNQHAPFLDLHWSMFKKDKYTPYFSVDDPKLLQWIQSEAETVNCVSCQDNIFTPKQCETQACSLLFAANYVDTSFVIRDIEELNLFVQVVWLGANFHNVTAALSNKYFVDNSNKSLVMLYYTPSEVINPESDYMRVSFPSCNILETYDRIDCRYEPIRILKIGWSKLQSLALPIYESLQHISFTRENYEDLFNRYNQNRHVNIEQLVCTWMNENEKDYLKWRLSKDPNISIHIGGIFPLTGNTSVAYTGAGILVASKMAQMAINSSPLLKGYTLKLLPHDGQCRSDKVMQKFIDIIRYENLLGVLGPACSETVEPLAGVSKYYSTVIISYSAEGVSFADRNQYPYFFRTIGENKHYNPVYLKLFQRLGWTRVAALAEDGQKYTEYISNLQDLLENHGITFVLNKKLPRAANFASMKKRLEELKTKRVRIIIADVYDELARILMCQAYTLNMTAADGFVWFLPMWLSTSWFNTSAYNVKYNERIPCTTEMMMAAINGHFSLSHAAFAPDNTIMQENRTVGSWRHTYNEKCRNASTAPSNFGGYAYDAMWTYAYALNALMRDDPKAVAMLHSYKTTLKLVDYIKRTNFVGVSGQIQFRGGPSRISQINIVQWLRNKLTLIGEFHPNVTMNGSQMHFDGHLDLNVSAITWLHGGDEIPDDGRQFGHDCLMGPLADLLDVSCEMAIVIANLVAFGSLGTVIVTVIYRCKQLYQKRLTEQSEYMRSLGLHDFENLRKRNAADGKNWELVRERVILTRFLGNGAFGEVFAGDAQIGDRWIGVAVKRLKQGADVIERINFMLEYEIMKTLDHENVVKLLGVVVQEQPYLCVMEHMLYGDLKTYLLARRHLIMEQRKSGVQFDEISDRQLTSFALGIARACSYLTSKNLVHRDIACRNCLVSGTRVIKLGDFGMCREIKPQNDYYRFLDRGLLPVRWMAPESLSECIFTSKTDVWSFGVLLYEIVTFGCLPFQGITNDNVVNSVTQGKIMGLPKKISPLLRTMMTACMNFNSQERPSASDLVLAFEQQPDLLSPALEGSLASYQVNDNDTSIDISEIPEAFRTILIRQHKKFKKMPKFISVQEEECLLKCDLRGGVVDMSMGGEYVPMQQLNGGIHSEFEEDNGNYEKLSRGVVINHDV